MPALRKLLPGLALISTIAALAMFAARRSELQAIGATPLTLAILLGVLLGNTRPQLAHGAFHHGLKFAQKRLLRAGVALYGFNLSLQQISEVGLRGVWIDVFIVSSTIVLGYWIGTRLLKMDTDATLLVCAGSAICGAAAVVATVPVLNMKETEGAQKAATAIATVVLFGTLAMFLYPLLFALLQGDKHDFGIYIGATIHEVAQVVAAGNAIGGEAAYNAVIVKMIRVLLLVPFLLSLSLWISTRSSAQGSTSLGAKIVIPWFALVFVLFTCLNSWIAIPPEVLTWLRQIGIICLTLAMAAFGMETTFKLLRQAGLKPLLLGAILFAYLVIFGGWLNLG